MPLFAGNRDLIEVALEKRFWRFWLGGLSLLAFMVFMNGWLTNDISPWGIRDHQSAASAMRVDAIQSAWQAARVLDLARFSIALDLIYIAVYSYGAFCGGRLFALTGSAVSRIIGRIVIAAAIVVCAADYAETICQFIQAMRFEGNDHSARIAATAQPIKSAAFVTSFFGILICLAMRRFGR